VFVFIDPFVAYLDGKVNSRIDHEIRRALMPVAKMAEDTGAAIMLVRHLNKTNDGPAIYRGGGSIGMIGAARSGMLVAQDPDDETPNSPRRVLASIKANLAARPASLRFTITGGENDAARIEWTGTSPHNANQLLGTGAGGTEERGELKRCKEWLGPYVAAVPRTSKEAAHEAREAGFSEATFRRAKAELGIISSKAGFGENGKWVLRCSYPPPDEHLSEKPIEMGTSPKALNEHLSDRGDAWEPEN